MAKTASRWAGPPLVCPACRRGATAFRLDEALRCSNPACGERHAWLSDGIAAVGTPAVRERIAAFDAAGELPRDGEFAGLLRAVRPGDPRFASLSRAAIFLRAMRARNEEPFYTDLCNALLPMVKPGLAVADLGGGASNLAFELARRGATHIVSLDLDAHMLRWAERAASGGEFEAPVRLDAGRFGTANMAITPIPDAAHISFLATNALDPPFEPSSFDVVTLVNILDAVPYPAVLLRQAVALLRPGGRLLFASPDSWNGGTTPPSRWLALDEAGWDGVFVAAGLETLAQIDDLEWRLQDTPRLHHLYRVHGRLLRKS